MLGMPEVDSDFKKTGGMLCIQCYVSNEEKSYFQERIAFLEKELQRCERKQRKASAL